MVLKDVVRYNSSTSKLLLPVAVVVVFMAHTAAHREISLGAFLGVEG